MPSEVASFPLLPLEVFTIGLKRRNERPETGLMVGLVDLNQRAHSYQEVVGTVAGRHPGQGISSIRGFLRRDSWRPRPLQKKVLMLPLIASTTSNRTLQGTSEAFCGVTRLECAVFADNGAPACRRVFVCARSFLKCPASICDNWLTSKKKRDK